jgi:uncharacterized protein YdgA (DUF945 family)
VKKSLPIIAIVIVLCLLVGPFATGMIAENSLRARIAAMSENNAWLDAEVISYQRAWFKSQARIAIRLDNDNLSNLADMAPIGDMSDALSQPLPIEIDIFHGPVSFNEGLHFGMGQVAARPDAEAAVLKSIAEMLNVPNLFEFRGRTGFGGRFDFTANVPAIDYAGPFGTAEFSGLDVVGSVAGTNLTTQATAERFNYQSPFAAAALDALQFDMRYEIRADKLPLGSSTFSIKNVVASSPFMGTGPLFELANFQSGHTLELNEAQATIDLSMTYSSDNLIAGEKLAVQDARIQLAVNGIDADATRTYYSIMDSGAVTEFSDPTELADLFQPAVDAALRRGFDIDVAPIEFSTPLGSLDSSIGIVVDGSSIPAGQVLDIRNIAVLLGVLTIDADIRVTKALALQIAAAVMRPQLAAALADTGQPVSEVELDAAADAQAGLLFVSATGTGVAIDDGTNYISSIQFRDGGLIVNGEPLPNGLF